MDKNSTLEAIKALYHDDAIIVPAHEIYRLDWKRCRFYVVARQDEEPIVRPSVTAIIKKEEQMSEGLRRWQQQNSPEYISWILEQSANYGTWFHDLISRLLLKGEALLDTTWLMADIEIMAEKKGWNWPELRRWLAVTSRDPRKDLYGFYSWAREYKPQPLAMEFPVYGPDAAGSIDFVGYINAKDKRELVIIDWKTGYDFYESHEIQLYAYKKMWNEMYPEKKVTRVFNYGCHDYMLPLKKRVTPYRFKDQTDAESTWRWKYYVASFKKRQISPAVFPDFKSMRITLDTEEQDPYEMVNPIQEAVNGGIQV